MNTIQITQQDGLTISYTEVEVKELIRKVEDLNLVLVDARAGNVRVVQDIGKLRNEVRDFFNEVEWEGGEQCVQKDDVNRLLESIGTRKLTTKYTGTGTIEFTFEIEADDEDEARSTVEDNISLQYSYVDILEESISIDDVSEY